MRKKHILKMFDTQLKHSMTPNNNDGWFATDIIAIQRFQITRLFVNNT